MFAAPTTVFVTPATVLVTLTTVLMGGAIGASSLPAVGLLPILLIWASQGVATRRSRVVGGREWVRLGAVEMALDCLRRYLQGLPVDERIDFEKV